MALKTCRKMITSYTLIVPVIPVQRTQVLSLYLEERREVQGNTSMRSREFPRAQPYPAISIAVQSSSHAKK